MAENQTSTPMEESANPNVIDVTPGKDGGVLKEIKREGSGEDGPRAGDKVSVHYVGTLEDGTKFDSSRDREERFEFDLGKGAVIKAWDLGVATMKRGELAVLTCKSEYAYGENGSPPTIPPGATLIFEVELFDWRGEDISPNHNGSILRSKLTEGDGYSSPNDGATVEIHVIGKYEGKVFEDKELQFALGEGMEHGISNGIEHALKKFKKGDRCLLTVQAEHAFGDAGCPEKGIPSGATVEYDITMKNFEKAKESWEMNITEKLEQSELSKSKGTNYFKAGKYATAIKFYDKIVTFLDSEGELEGEEKIKKDALLLAARLNLAMCCLKENNSVKAIEHCEKALEMDPANEKGHFRRGQAYLNQQDFDLAIADFKAVLEKDPNNKAARNQIVIANQKIKQEKEREKKMYGGMFQKFAAMDAKKEALNKTQEKDSEEKTEQKDSENGVVNSGEDTQESSTAESMEA